MITALLMLAAVPIDTLHANLKPWDVELPPVTARSVEGEIHVLFYRDPRSSHGGPCMERPGMITLACTIGKRPNPVITAMPLPTNFRDESFARAMDAAKGTVGEDGLWRESCAAKYSRQVYARLACHEVVGHQLGGWRHP